MVRSTDPIAVYLRVTQAALFGHVEAHHRNPGARAENDVRGFGVAEDVPLRRQPTHASSHQANCRFLRQARLQGEGGRDIRQRAYRYERNVAIAAHNRIDNEVHGTARGGPGGSGVPPDGLHLTRPMRFDCRPAPGVRIEQRLPETREHGNVSPAERVQDAACQFGPPRRIAEDRGDAHKLDLPAKQRERQRERVVNVVSDIRIEDDLFHPFHSPSAQSCICWLTAAQTETRGH